MMIIGIPQIKIDQCIKCGVPIDEICERCGCDCDNQGGRKGYEDYCPKGCKCGGFDNAPVFAADEVESDEDLQLAA